MKSNVRSASEGQASFLVPVYLVVFSAFFDTHAQMPVLAPYAAALGATPFMLGVVVGSYSLFNIIGNFFSGSIIDRKSWKYPLFSGLAGVSLFLVLYAMAGSTVQLVAIRAGHGFLGGLLVPAALACLAGEHGDSTFYGRRLAFFGATIGLAAVTGPLASGIIATRFGYSAVYYSLAAIMLVAAVAALLFLGRYPLYSRCPSSFPVTFRDIFRRPKILSAFMFAFGTMGSVGVLASFLPARSGMLGFSHAQTGMLFTTFALAAIIVQMLWPEKLKPFLGEDCRGCKYGLLLLCFALILGGSIKSPTALFISLGLFGIGFGLSFQGMLGMVIGDSQPGWRGRAIGFFFAVYSLGVVVVPPVSGLIWQFLPAVFPFYPAAAVALISMAAGSFNLQLEE